MKVLIIFALTIISFNTFAGTAKPGEDQKGECKFAVQSGRKTEPKAVEKKSEEPVKEEKKEGTKAV